MMKIRPDQWQLLSAGRRFHRRRELIAHIRATFPEHAETAEEVADLAIEDAEGLEIGDRDWPRFVALLQLPDEALRSSTGQSIFAVLAQHQRPSAERFDFIERHLLPRLDAP